MFWISKQTNVQNKICFARSSIENSAPAQSVLVDIAFGVDVVNCVGAERQVSFQRFLGGSTPERAIITELMHKKGTYSSFYLLSIPSDGVKDKA